MITPPYLKKGDTIGLAAPARKISRLELQAAINLFESWGLNTVFAENLFENHHQYAGTDSQRVAGMQQLMDEPSVKAILCARGGYGTVRMVDGLDFSRFRETPKWIAGYSDITVLHAHIHQQLQMETLHGTMPINFATNTPQSLESLRKALFGESQVYTMPHHLLNKAGSASAPVVGGNLSVLYALSGSASQLDTDGTILFLEDLEEYLYHIDRMMMQLQRSHKLKNLAGLLVGGMNNMNDNAIAFGKTAYEIIAEHVAEYDYPVCFGFPAGHIDNNHALILGRTMHLHVNENAESVLRGLF
ncbi:MAG: LD-carboxypeptidase [Bacteroidota bacterium]